MPKKLNFFPGNSCECCPQTGVPTIEYSPLKIASVAVLLQYEHFILLSFVLVNLIRTSIEQNEHDKKP